MVVAAVAGGVQDLDSQFSGFDQVAVSEGLVDLVVDELVRELGRDDRDPEPVGELAGTDDVV